jgi:hypothetical protein
LFFKIKHEQQINQELQIEKIKSKTLSDEINRASTTFVSKADLEKIIKEYGVNYSVIKNDDETTIVKSPNTANYVEFRFSIGVS